MQTVYFLKIAPRYLRIPGPYPGAAAARLVAVWYDRWLMRQELADLDDHVLRDVGLDRETVRREAEKPFWRA